MTLPRDAKLARVTRARELPLVEVEWRDACTFHPWQSLSDARKDMTLRCWTVGYLVRNSRDRVSLVQSRGEHDKVAEDWTIPRACIVRIRRLR